MAVNAAVAADGVLTSPAVQLADVQRVRALDISKRHEEALAIFALHRENLQQKHAKLFFKDVVQTHATNKQQLKGDCLSCGVSVSTSTGGARFTIHLAHCSVVPADVRKAFRQLECLKDQKAAVKRDALVLATEESELAAAEHEATQVTLKQQCYQCIRAGLKTADVAAADAAIANFFYANGIAFAAASSDATSMYRTMVRAIQNVPPNYVPPNANKLGGPLLDSCYESMWNTIHKRDPEGLLKAKFGTTYVSDGWDRCDSLPLINSAFITNNDGGIYWRCSVDTSGKVKSAEYCALLMIQDIYNFGPANVVLIITDTCNTMAKAWALVEDEFPWISILPCQPHVVSLLLKDIGKETKVVTTINEEATVVAWFANHQFPLAKLREYSLQKLGKAKELVRAAATRFGTHTLVGERLMELKPSLQATVVDSDYVAKNYKDAASTEEESGSGKVVRANKGATTKKLVLDDEGFWSRVTEHVKLTKPIVKMLRRFDSSAPAVGKVYSSWFELGQHIESSDAAYKDSCAEKHAERWAYGHSDFAAAAYVLDPEFQDHDVACNAEVMDGFNNVTGKIGILMVVRKNIDSHYADAWKARCKALGDDPSKLTSYDAFPTYPTAKDKDVASFCQKVSAQLVLYRGKKGSFGREWIMNGARDMPAYLWWDANGSSVAELQYMARMVLAQPASASICERINSEFAFVKDKRRNRLCHSRANKLVALFHNLRLISHVKKPNYTEPAIGWNEDDFHSGVVRYGVANYNSTALLPVKAPAKRPACVPALQQEVI